MGADETVLKVRGRRMVVGIVTDAESGRLGPTGQRRLRRWLQGYVSRFGVEAVVTDDLNTYKPAVEHLGVDHQVWRM